MDKIHRKSAISILIAIMFLIASLAIGSVNAYAIELEGAETGLKVNTSGVLVSTDNLAPGDTKTSSMTISLDSDSSVKDNTLPVWMRAEVIESIPGKSFEGKKGNLEDKLEFTITHENGEMLYKGLANGLGKTIVLGRIAKGESFDINISVHLPGAATGNEYQAASIKVKWKVITMYSPGPSPTPTEPSPTPTEPSPTPTEPSPTPVDPSPTPVVPSPTPIEPSPTPVDPSPTPVVPSPTPFDPTPTPTDGTIRDFEDEPVPEGSPEPEIEIIEEEFIPAGLPKTGELPPILFYGLGAGIVYAGIKLNKKKKN